MQLEKNENPCEQKSNQVGSKTSRKKSNVNYIEVVPSRPLYCMNPLGIERVLKLLFDPEERTPLKMVIENVFGYTMLIDYEIENVFCTTFGHPDTVYCDCIQDFLLMSHLDTDFSASELALWGITKVSLWIGDGSTRIVDTKTFFEALKQQLENKSKELVIQYDNEEIRIDNIII